ncbi:MAG: hypothetical protein NW200_06500 [Hyphomonadaceae bacterium]|nr:hypothetical protein [Hyphomonadaceae bacterium]
MNARAAPDLHRLNHLLLQMQVWLCATILWLCEWSGVRLPKAVRAELLAEFYEARRTTLMILVLHAVRRARVRPLPVSAAGAQERWTAPPGFRVQPHRGSDFRGFVRAIRIGGRTLRERYARLKAVIETMDRHVAALARRLAGSKAKAPVLARAVATVCAALCAPPVTAQDSS